MKIAIKPGLSMLFQWFSLPKSILYIESSQRKSKCNQNNMYSHGGKTFLLFLDIWISLTETLTEDERHK